jgi:glycosyltransferase involved in cell wall biosynthesis
MNSGEGKQPVAPAVTVIVPVYQGEATIRRCLDSVYASSYKDFELIVVDDGSHDSTVEIIRSYPAILLQRPRNLGAAAARNAGAREARGSTLYFLDADIVMQPDTLARTLHAFAERPEICAVFGSFDKRKVPGSFVSDYKNLLHHYTHQTASPNSSSFCGGFSAIRRDVFLDAGGFNPEHEFLEDVEFGYRLRAAAHLIWLKRDLQLTHCKHYTLRSLVRSDVYGRAIPWTRLILERRTFANDLSTQTHHVLSLPLSFLLLGALLTPGTHWFAAPLAAAWIFANRGFLNFIRRERGMGFAIRGTGMCFLGYIYSGVGVTIAVLGYAWDRARQATAALGLRD